MRLRLDKLPGFADDFHDLPDDEVRRATIQKLVEIANGEVTGLLLDTRASTGDLSDCRKIYFDVGPRIEKPAYRLVYRLTPNEVRAVAVEAVAVGERFELDAYLRAARNLGRS